LWEQGAGQLHRYAAETREQLHDMHESGNRAWDVMGVAINRMGDLYATLYCGEHFDNNVAVIISKDQETLKAIYEFCLSPHFVSEVRKLDRTLKVTNKTLLKTPFDADYWTKIAAYTQRSLFSKAQWRDPTQWLFDGNPKNSHHALNVAVARLL